MSINDKIDIDAAMNKLTPLGLGALFHSAIEFQDSLLALPKTSHTDRLKQRFDCNDLVVSFYPDGTGSVEYGLIKGHSLARRVVEAKISSRAAMAGILCSSIEESEAMRIVLGAGSEIGPGT